MARRHGSVHIREQTNLLSVVEGGIPFGQSCFALTVLNKDVVDLCHKGKDVSCCCSEESELRLEKEEGVGRKKQIVFRWLAGPICESSFGVPLRDQGLLK